MPCSKISVVSFLALAFLCVSAWAQNDRVFPVNGNPISGKVETVSKNGITLLTGGTEQQILGNTIVKIMFSGDPAELTRGREFALDNQFDQALEALKKVNMNNIRRKVITEDVIYYRLLSEAKLSLIGQSSRATASANLINFVKTYKDSWHYFEAARLLGDLAVADGKYSLARNSYGVIGSAAAPELKIESAYLTSMVLMYENKPAEAQAGFQKVVDARVDSPTGARLQLLAQAGLVAALGQQGQTDAAIKASESLIAELSPTDTELAARIYNARGAAFAKAGQNEAAIRAYLHTHLMFSGTPDAHVESLQALLQLWPKVGKPNRANEMRQVLQQSYPGWGG
ncbi:tetratricopeptide repeat protein [Roseimaritima ulvae]|uniref:Tetratricopeptide repeat protein n=1 Tax=Roseimaritima ulvae TaxID=980254 RepID=A0A5B9QZE2_9BACT|nr:hypothetical protein [Roseimaritima ulvae]QEG42795.1 hypothetical protein UC8_48370 [Roseimaritima ulvae]